MKCLARFLVSALCLLAFSATALAQPADGDGDSDDPNTEATAPGEGDGDGEDGDEGDVDDDEPFEGTGGIDPDLDPNTLPPPTMGGSGGDSGGSGADALPDDAFEALDEMEPEVLEAITPRKGYPFVRHEGYFRFRTDAFYNLDLNTRGTSPIPPPPSRVGPNSARPANPDADWYTGANIRFRYTPTFEIYEDLGITLQLDVPDNIVLGSQPNGLSASGEVPVLALTQGQTPPDDRFGLRVRQAYGTLRLFVGTLQIGRMADHWGLGMQANGGQCIDCDFGDFADRIRFTTHAFDFYISLFYDFTAEGPITYPQGINNPQGQPRDADTLDDITQVGLEISTEARTDEELAEQRRILKEEAKPVFNGGFRLVYRSQEAAYEGYTLDQDTADLISDADQVGLPAAFTLQNRDAELWMPNLWGKLLWEPRLNTRLRVEAEFAAVLGNIGFVSAPAESNDPDTPTECFSNPDDTACSTLSREVQQLGFALEAELRVNQLFTVGLYTGYASGSDAFGFQLNDKTLALDRDLTAFTFDRDYILDQVLFRELIGGVTNATYFKPWVQFDFWTLNNDSIGLRLDLMYAFANEAEATPSGESSLGVEFGSMLYYTEKNKYRVDLSYGMLIPLGAFDEQEGRPRLNYPGATSPVFTPEEAAEAELAHTIQARMFWLFQ